MSIPHPLSAEGLTPEFLSDLVREAHPGTTVEKVRVVEAKRYGDQMVSTAARAVLELEYAGAEAAKLPRKVVVKLAREVDHIMGPLYANEVAFYRRLRPELTLEAPATLGASYDPSTRNFALILEDLTVRGARFPNVTQAITVDGVKGLLDTVAALHARYWQSPRFKTDLSWMETHLQGGLAHMMNNEVPGYIQYEIDNVNFKRELVQRLRTTGPELFAGVQKVQRHQATLRQTVLHGDTHLGNTYLLPGNRGGLLDWQLMVRGYCMHDVNYLVTTALSIGDRRTHERDLVAYYLDRLAAAGATDIPSFDEAWKEFRRTLVWGVYIGWLTTPVVNYGWEINILNHLRLTTAFEDHETAKLVAELG